MRRFDRNKKTFCSRKFHSLLLTASVSMGMEYLMLLSDSIIIGNIFGEAAIAASNLVSPIFSVAVFVCSHGKTRFTLSAICPLQRNQVCLSLESCLCRIPCQETCRRKTLQCCSVSCHEETCSADLCLAEIWENISCSCMIFS